MNTNKMIKYEMPWIAEFISINWLQDVVARYVAFKVSRKIKRYNHRIEREKWVKQLISNQ